MARVAIGDRDEFHVVAQGGELRRRARGADIAVVRMRAEGDDAKLAIGILRRKHGCANQRQQSKFQHEARIITAGFRIWD